MIINITPVAKPRMVRSDKWKKRPVVLSYWAFKDELTLLTKRAGVKLSDELNVVFVLPMPISWSKKKRQEMDGKPHQQKSDLDNLVKAIQDCLLKDDSGIYKINASKYWGIEGKIIFL
jgi:Holliday junction resolvase RusA-like endonuclease